MVHLSTIGPLAIQVGSTRLTAASQRACAALFYLVVERGKEIPRRTLLPLFFPDSSEAAGSHALRQLIYRLRKLGVALDGDGASVTLPVAAASWDVESIESRGRFTEYELELLARGYLPDFDPGVSEAFDQWLDVHRTTVSTALRRSLLVQMREDKAQHEFASVDRAARACPALDPFNEEATLATAEVLVMSGSKTEALAVLDRYTDEVGPRSRELRLAHRIELLLRAVVPVRVPLREEPVGDLAIAGEALHLEEGALGIVEPEPLHGIEDRLNRLLRRAFEVRVLDAQHESAPVALRIRPVEERGAGAAEVEVAGGARREARADQRITARAFRRCGR